MPSLYIGGFHSRGQLHRRSPRNCCALVVEHVIYVCSIMCIIVCTFIKWRWKLQNPGQHYCCFTSSFNWHFGGGGGAPSLGFGGRGGYKLVRQRKNNGLLAQIQLDPLVRCWLAGWPTKPLFGFPAKPSMWVWLKTKAQIFAAVQFAIQLKNSLKTINLEFFYPSHCPTMILVQLTG